MMNGPDTPDGFPVRTTHWETDRPQNELLDKITARFGEPVEDHPFERWWRIERFGGLFEGILYWQAKENRLTYRVWQTMPLVLLQCGLLIILSIITGMRYLGILPAEAIVPDDPYVAGGISITMIIGLYVLALLHRGPPSTLDGDEIHKQSTSHSSYYFLLTSLAAFFLGYLLGVFMDIALFGGIFFIILAFAKFYADGAIPDLHMKASEINHEPLFSPGFTGQFKIALLTIIPAVLTVISWTCSMIFTPVRPSGLLSLIGAVIFPISFTVIYFYMCFRVFNGLAGERLEPHISLLGRLLVFICILFGNVIMIVIVGVSFSLPIHAEPILFPEVYYIELFFAPMDLTAYVLLLFSFSIIPIIVLRLWEYINKFIINDIVYWAIGKFLRFLREVSLFVLFGLVAYLLTGVVSLLIFGDGAIHDPSPQTARLNLESGIAYTNALEPLPASLAAGIIPFIRLFPVAIVGFVWADYVDLRLQRWMNIRQHGKYLDTTERPVPDDIRVLAVPDGEVPSVNGNATATTTILSGPRIIISDVLVEELNDRELDAVLAHESYHIQNRDHIVNAFSMVASVLFGGSNVILSFTDLARSEVEADLYASRIVSMEATNKAVWKMKGLTKEAAGSTQSVIPIGPGLSGDFALSIEDADDDESVREKTQPLAQNALAWIVSLIFAPRRLLSGELLYKLAHPTVATRSDNLKLQKGAIRFVRRHTRTTSVVLPREHQVTCPVPRWEVHEHLSKTAVSPEFANEVLDALIEDGMLVERGEDLLLVGDAGEEYFEKVGEQ